MNGITSFIGKNELLDSNRKVNDILMTDHEYPMFYERGSQYIQLNPFVLTQDKYNELVYATEKMNEILHILSNVIRTQLPYLQEVFVTSDIRYLYAISQMLKYDEFLTILGRYDWGIDENDNLKLFEFNCDTPAGLWEASTVSQVVYEQLNDSTLINPNMTLLQQISDSMDAYIINNFGKRKSYNITFACCKMEAEDFYNVKLIYDYYQQNSKIKHKLNFDFVDVSDIKVAYYKNGNPKFMYTDNQKKTDIFYRFYPLEWFADNIEFPFLGDVLRLISERKVLTVNPPSTMAIHSKGMMALLYQILEQSKNVNQQIFTQEHLEVLEKYMLPTYLQFEKEMTGTFVVKAFFDREGANIKFIDSSTYNPSYIHKDVIYQEKLNLKKLQFFTEVNNKIVDTEGSLVLSSYSIGNQFGGVLTRIGNEITDKEALFLPTYVNKNPND